MVVYLITNNATGRRYVGKTEKLLAERWGAHLRSAKKNPKTYLHKAIHKYGPEAFNTSVLFTGEDSAALCEVEKFWISELKTKVPNGYNLTDGGEGVSGFKMPAAAIEKTAAAKRGVRQSLEHIAKAAIGRKGRKCSPETISKMSAANMGKRLSPEHRAKLAKAHLGMKQSPETVAKRVSKIRGKKRSPEMIAKMVIAHTGKKYSEQAKLNMSLAARRRWMKEAA